MICSSCQADVPVDAAFCAKCGNQLSRDQPTPSDPLLTALKRAAGSQYEVIRLLGRGGMGAVFLARETALDRLVAIKVLPPECADSEGYERFRREAKTAARLTHPNIVPLHTFGESDGMMYFVMGYVSGESLKDRLQRTGKIDHDETRRILADVATALHYSHEQGVVHRDIKPDNILLEDETGKPMLTDFGVAKSVAPGETLTQVGATLGTPHYMSPEQAAGDGNIDGRSDLYSLGVVGYEMLTGRLPFEGGSIRELLVQHVTKDPVPVGVLDPTIPEDLARVVNRCMAKECGERMENGLAMHAALGVLTGPGELMPPDLEETVRTLRSLAWISGGLISIGYVFQVAGDFAPAAFFALGGVGMFSWTAVSERRSEKLERYSWREILRWVFRQPKRWTIWWPRRLRPSDDMWDRLPKPVKRSRIAQGVVAASVSIGTATLAGLLWTLLDPTEPGTPGSPILDIVFPAVGITFYCSLVWAVIETVRGQRWARRIGLDKRAQKKLWSAPNSDTDFWTKPPLDAYLQAVRTRTGIPGATLPQTPQEFVDAIVRTGAEQKGAPGVIAKEAAELGRELFGMINKLDEQIRSLKDESDPNEVPQLEQKLAALGETTASESDFQIRKRELLNEQLDLARRLAKQFEHAQRRRDHLIEMLRTVWRQVANLKTHAGDPAFDSGEISEKVRALSEDVRRYQDAAVETVRVLQNPS